MSSGGEPVGREEHDVERSTSGDGRWTCAECRDGTNGRIVMNDWNDCAVGRMMKVMEESGWRRKRWIVRSERSKLGSRSEKWSRMS